MTPEEKIEAAIRETLVVTNPQSIWRAVEKIAALSTIQPVSGGVEPSRVKELEEALAHLLKMSDTWGHEWFNNETWAKLENARKVLKHE